MNDESLQRRHVVRATLHYAVAFPSVQLDAVSVFLLSFHHQPFSVFFEFLFFTVSPVSSSSSRLSNRSIYPLRFCLRPSIRMFAPSGSAPLTQSAPIPPMCSGANWRELEEDRGKRKRPKKRMIVVMVMMMTGISCASISIGIRSKVVDRRRSNSRPNFSLSLSLSLSFDIALHDHHVSGGNHRPFHLMISPRFGPYFFRNSFTQSSYRAFLSFFLSFFLFYLSPLWKSFSPPWLSTSRLDLPDGNPFQREKVSIKSAH